MTSFCGLLRRPPKDARCTIIGVAISAALLWCCDGGAKASEDILRLESSISLPDSPVSVAWTSDGRQLAVFGFNTRKILFVDVDRHELIDRNLQWRGGNPTLAWSPDGQTIAGAGSFTALLSSQDGKELGRSDLQRGRCSFQTARPVSFTPDGRFIWLDCGAFQQAKIFTAAYKLAIPTLEVVDAIQATSSGDYNSSRNARVIVSQGKATFTSVMAACFDRKAKNGQLDCTDYFTCVDVEARRACFPPVKLSEFASSGKLVNAQLNPSGRWIASLWHLGSRVNGATEDWKFVIQDLDGAKIRQFGSSVDMDGIYVRDFAITENDRVFAALSDPERNLGGLRIWNVTTGELLQRISSSPLFALSLSPAGNRIAAIALSEIRIYSIKP